ncbi:MAG: protein kinase [Victivallales bacterium]|nr:protein kinase [Victivallales bacterium]
MLNDNIAELEAQLAANEIACPHCHAVYLRDGLEPLTTVTCQSCGKPFLVGMMVGRYYLQELAARSKFYSTYLALANQDGDAFPVEVKLIATASQTHPSQIKALWNEAQVGGLLNDTDFVSGCLDHGVSNGYYYIVRPYVEGERLDQHIARCGKLPVEHAIKLALHLLAALQHIYRTGFLYRNLQPANVLINPFGYAVLYDLGQCRPVNEAKAPETSPQSETPVSFHAPERLLHQGETLASELYSLGMVLYYALTGHPYFSDEEFADLLARRFAGTRPSSGRFTELPASLAILLDTMLRFNSAERPQECADVVDSLKAILMELEED